MLKNIMPSLKLTLIMIVLFAVVYPLIIWGIAQFAPNSGKGITIEKSGKTIGFENIAQKFTRDKYFWPRPSAVNYNAAGSGGSNKSPYNPDYVKSTQALLDSFLKYNPEVKKEEIPSEMITMSGSGLDPDITVQGAMIQVPRIAKARKLSRQALEKLISDYTDKPTLGFLGIERINVLKLNIALDNTK
jgi:potassium-transporting ATPase KdpC subunit